MRICALLLGVLGLLGYSSEGSVSNESGNRQTFVDLGWEQFVGKSVVVEGLAWGVYEKGLGQRVIVDHGHIYVHGPMLPNGKLVRVAGMLRRGQMKPAPPGSQGYNESFEYLYIEAAKVKQIDVVELPQLLEPVAEQPQAADVSK